MCYHVCIQEVTMTSKTRKIINVGIAGEEISPGLFKTVTLARNGVFETKKSWMGEHTYKVSSYKFNESPAVPELQEELKLAENLTKLPFEAFSAVYRFYKYVQDLNGNEAQINFYINHKGIEEISLEKSRVEDGVTVDYVETMKIKEIPGVHFWTEDVFSYVPIQRNSSALTTTDDPIYLEIRKLTLPYIETHSHNSMSAFKSGTDEANSHIEGLQLVFGRLNTNKYDFKSWATVGGKQYDDLTHEELSKFIEMPEEIGNIEELLDFEVPQEWLDQCTWATSAYKRKRSWTDYDYWRTPGYANSYSSFDEIPEAEQVELDFEDHEDIIDYVDDFTEDHFEDIQPYVSSANKHLLQHDNPAISNAAKQIEAAKTRARNEAVLKRKEDEAERRKADALQAAKDRKEQRERERLREERLASNAPGWLSRFFKS